MTGRWFAVVESNTTGTGRQFCAAARARGLRPVMLSRDPGRYPYVAEDGIDVIAADTTDGAEVLSACRGLALNGGLAGVTSSSEYFAATAAEVASALGLPGPPPLAVAACRDKSRQRAALSAAGVPTPAHRTVRDVAGAIRAAAEIGGPVVLKPTRGSGSAGVKLCRTHAETASWAATLLDGADEFLVEEYVEGPEYSVETFGTEVVGVVGKHLGAPPHFVETGHDFPADAPPEHLAALGECARAALSALGLGWGAAHTELRMTSRGPVVIEVNPRLAGGMIPELVRLAAGVDLVDAVVAAVAGQPRANSRPGAGHSCIRFLLATSSGTVTGITGMHAAHRSAVVKEVQVREKRGDRVSIDHSFTDRIGFVITSGTEANQIRQEAETAASAVAVVIHPLPEQAFPIVAGSLSTRPTTS